MVVDQGKPIAAQAISFGVNRKIADVPLDELKTNVVRTIYSLAKQLRERQATHLLIVGQAHLAASDLEEALCKLLQKEPLVVPDHPSFGMNSAELVKYALSIGEALSALPGKGNQRKGDQINFRAQEFAYPSPWKRLKKPVLTYMVLCISLAFALFLYGKTYSVHKKGALKYQFLDLLAGMNRSYPDFESEYRAKTKSLEEFSDSPSIAALKPEEIQMRLDYLEKEIQLIPQIYPLYPNVPLVSDVLAWLSTHPSFTLTQIPSENTDLEKTSEQQIALTNLKTPQIEIFNYVMTKRPDSAKKGEKYQVKIELEFSSPIPKMAREFHDALIAPNDFVDSKAEIKWTSNKDRYRTTFYLKDKTVYP